MIALISLGFLTIIWFAVRREFKTAKKVIRIVTWFARLLFWILLLAAIAAFHVLTFCFNIVSIPVFLICRVACRKKPRIARVAWMFYPTFRDGPANKRTGRKISRNIRRRIRRSMRLPQKN